jgi:hypothetical protein
MEPSKRKLHIEPQLEKKWALDSPIYGYEVIGEIELTMGMLILTVVLYKTRKESIRFFLARKRQEIY